jgi:hypothetical protein
MFRNHRKATKTESRAALQELTIEHGGTQQTLEIEEIYPVFPARGHTRHISIMNALIANGFLEPHPEPWSTYTTTSKFELWANDQF